METQHVALMSQTAAQSQETADRLSEIADILAAGFLRLRAKRAEQSNCARSGESGLDFPPDRSVHATVSKPAEQAA